MGLATDVVEALCRGPDVKDPVAESNALREADRLADMFEFIKPTPWIVPIERLVGMPVPGEGPVSGKDLPDWGILD